MNILQIIAHPDISGSSFTGQLASAFKSGAEANGHVVDSFNLYNMSVPNDELSQAIIEADHICFAWPCWWEMPPAVMVEFFQSTFIKGFAFDISAGKATPTLNIPTTCLISLGQTKNHDVTNLRDAMTYCGLYPKFHVFNGVGPGLPAETASIYLRLAEQAGLNL